MGSYIPNSFALSWAWVIGKSCSPPCELARACLGLGVVVDLTSALRQHAVLEHSAVGAAQPVLSRSVGIVAWAGRLAVRLV